MTTQTCKNVPSLIPLGFLRTLFSVFSIYTVTFYDSSICFFRFSQFWFWEGSSRQLTRRTLVMICLNCTPVCPFISFSDDLFCFFPSVFSFLHSVGPISIDLAWPVQNVSYFSTLFFSSDHLMSWFLYRLSWRIVLRLSVRGPLCHSFMQRGRVCFIVSHSLTTRVAK